MKNKVDEMIKKIEDGINSLSREEIEERNRKEIENHNRLYEEFENAFKKGICCFCNSKLKEFKNKEPCLHWLLHPEGIKKDNFKREKFFEKYSLQQIESYLRWVANTETFGRNINDLTEEDPNQILQLTINFKELEWSLDCKKMDLEGHPNRRFRRYPHYHLQMRINHQRFIDYTDFHIPLTDQDLVELKITKGGSDKIHHFYGRGTGMKDIMDNFDEELLRATKVTDDYKKATIHTSYKIQAEEGKTIPGKRIVEAIKETKKTGKPFIETFNCENAQISAITSLGEGVPEKAKRKKRKR
ncbi:MAG: hypothetical protein PHT54_04525 [Candidatus Nanoarchaeia archaeon]|nr:hypothetical protein [Candidatus Nanoarchaeia archaeon]